MDGDINQWHSRFNEMYKWLILSNEESDNFSDVIDQFSNVKLRMDSDVSIAQLSNGSYNIYDIYNSGFDYGGYFKIRKKYEYSVSSQQFYETRRETSYDIRKNMSELHLRAVTVITKQISVPAEEYLLDKTSKDDSVNKCNYAVYKNLLEIHQFRYTLIATNTWYGPSAIGTDGGMSEHLWYRTAEISATSGIMTGDRVLGVDYMVSTYYFGSCFIFRNPSAIGKIRNQFFDPFTTNTWYICVLFCILLAILLKITYTVHSWYGLAAEEHGTWSSAILNTLAAFCQQDIETDEQNITGRILILTLMFFSLLLYNYYTSSIVSDLINSRAPAFTTIDELVHSSLDLGMEQIAYVTRLFKTTEDPDMIYLRDKRILAPGEQNKYYDSKVGIENIKYGGFAYHMERSTAYHLIGKYFESAEICDLCEIYVFKPTLVYILIQKKSEYKELFLISYRKMMERGIIARERLIWQTQKPLCESSANVLQIELEQMAPAFFVLLFGVVVSNFILMIEKKNHSTKIIKDRNYHKKRNLNVHGNESSSINYILNVRNLD